MMRGAMTMAACLLAAACAGGGPADATPPDQQLVGGERQEARALFPGRMHYSGIQQRERTVIRRQDDWQAFWTRAFNRQMPAPAPAAAGFSREVGIVAALGGTATGGYAVSIDSVSTTPGTTHVFVTERSPGRQCVTTQALTQPVDAVAVADAGGAVRFHERSVVHECD